MWELVQSQGLQLGEVEAERFSAEAAWAAAESSFQSLSLSESAL